MVLYALELQKKDDIQEEGQKLYRKYKESQKEAIRLAAALRGFFLSNGISKEQRDDFGFYIQTQIVPAVQELIEEEAVERIVYLESRGWFSEELLESFIRIARERHKTNSLVRLMHLKDEKYGYAEKDFLI